MDQVDGVIRHSLSPDDFPFTVKFFREGTDDLVHEVTMEGPGTLHVPPLAQHGPVRVEIHWPDGEIDK